MFYIIHVYTVCCSGLIMMLQFLNIFDKKILGMNNEWFMHYLQIWSFQLNLTFFNDLWIHFHSIKCKLTSAIKPMIFNLIQLNLFYLIQKKKKKIKNIFSLNKQTYFYFTFTLINYYNNQLKEFTVNCMQPQICDNCHP